VRVGAWGLLVWNVRQFLVAGVLAGYVDTQRGANGQWEFGRRDLRIQNNRDIGVLGHSIQ